MLSWKYFQITTRLAYGLYLVQTPLQFFNAARIRVPGFGSHVKVMVRMNSIYFHVITFKFG